MSAGLTNILSIALGAILVNNFIFSQFLGCCPFLGVSKKLDTAMGMGLAVTFVMGLASAVCYAVNEFILVKFDLQYMQTVAFILVIAALVQFIEMFLQKSTSKIPSQASLILSGSGVNKDRMLIHRHLKAQAITMSMSRHVIWCDLSCIHQDLQSLMSQTVISCVGKCVLIDWCNGKFFPKCRQKAQHGSGHIISRIVE